MGLPDFADSSLRLKPRLREAIQKFEQISERRSIIWNRDGTSALPSFWEYHGEGGFFMRVPIESLSDWPSNASGPDELIAIGAAN